ncbi:MAG: hypothetical protein D3910_10060 [Candidatus Electrothrix sp. ATG2]|nr:hypothetical protein [Candidatus Electrothrix sp. ATG2]
MNFDDLIFLVEKKSPGLLTNLSFFQQKTNSTVDVLNEYSYIHHNHIQSRIMKLDPIPSSLDKLDAEIDERYLLSAKSHLDLIIESTDEIIPLSKTLIKELNSMLKNEFPKHNILNLLPASDDKPKNE